MDEQPTFLTCEGHQKLKQELNHLRTVRRQEVARRLHQALAEGDILENAKQRGADVIAVACPMCHANLDTRQAEIEEKRGEKFDMPILYFTQLMGLAFGESPEKLALDKHLVDTGKVPDAMKVKS